jgi:hypothetical protein
VCQRSKLPKYIDANSLLTKAKSLAQCTCDALAQPLQHPVHQTIHIAHYYNFTGPSALS